MNNAADVTQPPDATHVQWFYGSPQYYKKTTRQHLNQVSEEWQTMADWFLWNYGTMRWETVGSGFSSRRLKML